MPTRVSEAEVKELLAPLAQNTSMTIFINQANMLVDEELVGKGLSDNRLKYIELNLAAHFATLAVERGGLISQRMGDSEETYESTKGKAKYSSTRFGQTAISLDTTGLISKADNPGGFAEFKVIGQKPY